jgi:O-antigen ligase
MGFICLVQIYTYFAVGLTPSTGRGGYGIIVGGRTILGGGGVMHLETAEGVNGVGAYSSHFLGNASELGLALCVAYPLCYYFFRGLNRRPAKVIFGILTIVLMMSIFVSGSRGAFLGFVATLIYLLRKERKLILGLVILAIISLPALYIIGERYIERVESIADYETDESVNVRFRLWSAAVDMVADHPLFGVGTGNFANAYGSTYRAEGSRSLYWSPHNVFIQIITELGILGFTIYIILIIAIYKINKKSRDILRRFPDLKALRLLTKGIDVAVVGYVVSGQFITATYTPHLFQLSFLASVIYAVGLKRLESSQGTSG